MKSLTEIKIKYMQDEEFKEDYKALEETYRIAEKIIEARLKAGLTQAELAAKLNTKQANISRLESGMYNPTIVILIKVAQATGNQLEINFVQ